MKNCVQVMPRHGQINRSTRFSITDAQLLFRLQDLLQRVVILGRTVLPDLEHPDDLARWAQAEVVHAQVGGDVELAEGDGEHLGVIRGGLGDDSMENEVGGEDLWQGDLGVIPEFSDEPTVKGHDVFIGYDGNNDMDMENGDDVMVDGPGVDRAEGQLGFDWISFLMDKWVGDKLRELEELGEADNTIVFYYADQG